MPKWIATAVGLMHIHKITHKRLADKLGFTREYITMILNNKVSPPNAKEKVLTAINELIAEDSNG